MEIMRFRFNLFTVFWLMLLVMILQKSPDLAIFLLIIYVFYKYLKRKKSAERILASELAKANKTLAEMKKIPRYLGKISGHMRSIANRAPSDGDRGDGQRDNTSPFEKEMGPVEDTEDIEPIELRSLT